MNIIKLSEIVEIRTGYAFRERVEARADGDIAVVQMKDIDGESRLRADSLVRVQLASLNDSYRLRPGDLLLRARGLRNTACLLTDVPDRTVAAAPLVLLRVTDKSIDAAYLQWFINQPPTQAALADVAGGTYAKTVNKAALEQLVIAIPSLKQQRQIVELAGLLAREQALLSEISDARTRMVEGILWQFAQDARRTPG